MEEPITDINNSTETTPKTELVQKAKKRSFIIRFLRGDLLLEVITKEVLLGIIITCILGIIYISNRYNVQQKQMEIYNLRFELQDIKYRALTEKATLLNKSRQSKIEEHLKKTGSILEIPSNPPYRIK